MTYLLVRAVTSRLSNWPITGLNKYAPAVAAADVAAATDHHHHDVDRITTTVITTIAISPISKCPTNESSSHRPRPRHCHTALARHTSVQD